MWTVVNYMKTKKRREKMQSPPSYPPSHPHPTTQKKKIAASLGVLKTTQRMFTHALKCLFDTTTTTNTKQQQNKKRKSKEGKQNTNGSVCPERL